MPKSLAGYTHLSVLEQGKIARDSRDGFLASTGPLLKIKSRRNYVFDARHSKALSGPVDACF